MPEVGRANIRDQVAIGGTALPWADCAAFVELMLEVKLRSQREAGALACPVIFYCTVPDVIGICGCAVCQCCIMLKVAATFRYAPRAFVVRPWREIFAANAERKQHFTELEATHAVIIKTYACLSY